MKNIFLLLIFTFLVLTGCNSNKDTNIPPDSNKTQITSENEISKDNEGNNIEEDNKSSNKDEKLIAPDFELETLDKTTIKLSDLRDKNVILNFWATWCGFCVEEMPDLQKLQEKYKDEDLLILAVNVGETKEEVLEFVEENNLELQVVLDKDMSIANTYGVRSFPSTLTINKKGEAVASHIGMLTYEQMEQLYKFYEE